MALKRPLIIAHRFGNEIPLIQQAVEAGADYVEADVWVYRGRLEVRHAKTLGPLPVLWDKWYLRRRSAHVLSLDQVLEAMPPGLGIMIDLKGSDARMPELVLDALRRHGGSRPVMVSARFWAHLASLCEYPDLMLFHSVGSRRQLRRVRPLLNLRQHDAISIQYTLLDADVVRSLKSQVSLVATWAINDVQRLQNAREWGVDAVITDDISIMRRIAALSS